MRKSVQQQRFPQAKRLLNKYSGADLEYLMEGKSIEQLTKNSTTYEKFKYRAKYLSEKTARQKTLANMEQKIKVRKEKEIAKGVLKAKKLVKKQLDVIKNKYSEEDYRIATRLEGLIPSFDNVDSTIKLKTLQEEVKTLNMIDKLEDIVKEEATESLKERYFKVFQNDVEKEERINDVIEKLGGRLGTYNELLDHITGESFKGSDYDKKGMYRSADEQYEIMTDRLDRIEKWVEVNT